MRTRKMFRICYTMMNASEPCENEIRVVVKLNGLKYIAGYVAFKCQNIDKSLGVCQKKCKDLYIQLLNGWIKLDNLRFYFQHFLDLIFPSAPNVIKTWTAMLQAKFPKCDQKAVHLYAKTRTFIPIRHLNKYAAKKRTCYGYNLMGQKYKFLVFSLSLSASPMPFYRTGQHKPVKNTLALARAIMESVPDASRVYFNQCVTGSRGPHTS
ncbi:hypothetical protein PR048_001784 [Dryococelus australis]|uniref:Uncharacterized protein n=1 Tax=Dryococelus australis TaxID=614101 RepID=A0ABQ9IJS6_9NEOP|nr:hypothetical protein PR048_001784 [Dryococelus australis]